MERKIHFREKWLIFFMDFGKKLYLFQGFGEQMKYNFRELRNFLSGILRDQCIIFRDQGSTDIPGGLRVLLYYESHLIFL